MVERRASNSLRAAVPGTVLIFTYLIIIMHEVLL